MPRGKRPAVRQPVPAITCSNQWERASGSVAATKWFDIRGAKDGTPSVASILEEFHFDGGTDAVPTTLVAPAKTENWTMVFWCIRDSSDDGQITSWSTRAAAGTSGWTMRANTAGSLDPLDFDQFCPAYSAELDPFGGAITDNKWHHLAMTWTPGNPNSVTCYVDGVAKSTFSDTLANQYASSVNDFLLIGKGNFNHWTGFIDTARVWGRTLSPDEVAHDYRAGIAGHQARVIEENLISQYVPQGQTTTAWADVTGSNNMTGTVTAPPVFDGNDYYSIGNPANLQFTTNFSIEAWGSQDADASQGYERLISRDDIGANRVFAMSQHDTNGNPYAAIFVGGVVKTANGTGNYADGNWHHYVATHDGVTLRLYVDGDEEASVATGGAMDNDPIPWEIGRAGNGTDYLEGRCDTVRFYNATLSLAQIQQNYQAGLAAHS